MNSVMRNQLESTTKTISMINDNAYMEPIIAGSGSGGQGFGAGQLPVQSTQEHVPLVFYLKNMCLYVLKTIILITYTIGFITGN